MCKAFSCIVKPDASVIWKLGVDSHTSLLQGTGLKDLTSDPSLLEFARVEISPKNNNYLEPDTWEFSIDQSITPTWFGQKHKEAANSAHKKWLSQLDKILIRKKIIHPFKIKPPEKITKKHIQLLRSWDSVWASVWASVGASVWASVGASVWASVGASVWASVGASVRASVGASVGAYTGSFFKISKWKIIKHRSGRYPFGPAVQLWKLGLVPSFDGKIWRLHGGEKAAVLFEITAEEIRKKK
jgi:hypothetical protein